MASPCPRFAPSLLLISAASLLGASMPLPKPAAPWAAGTGIEAVDGYNLALPAVGEGGLRVLTPTMLEVACVSTKRTISTAPESWDLVNGEGQLAPPAATAFAATVNGQPVAVTKVGFRRRPLYAPLVQRDLRLDNRLFLELAAPVAEGQTVAVKDLGGTLWPENTPLTTTAERRRLSPVLHVNQEGYLPAYPKQAMVGYYLGSLGELTVTERSFQVLRTGTGEEVLKGELRARVDKGFGGTPEPYQQVLEADFTELRAPGSYVLAVPGLGVSVPFSIHEGVAMNFTRAYALGLLHQRCGAENALPYTRFTHAKCHPGPAQVPLPAGTFGVAWMTIANASAKGSNPRHTSPRVKGPGDLLFPYVNTGKVDVCGGHHDAGDYSKYTINSAQFVHTLIFAADALPGAAALDNLGLPESGDGKSDLLQIAKWEADFLAKMQDEDGGFYFLVYPRARSYESNVLPDAGDEQIVWPKNTSATAAAVAALAQASSSPAFRQQFPAAAADYRRKALLGWKFLQRALAKYGKDGAYQKLTHYGNEFMHDDELAWAACEIYLATGDAAAHQRLLEWYNPANKDTKRWTWWRMYESYGCAARSYAFAARTGRLQTAQQDAPFLAKCEAEVQAAGDEARQRTADCAYGTAFESESKRVRAAGWYFSTDRAFDIAVAHAMHPSAEYLAAIVSNMNFEGGCNPVNVCYVTGLGVRRQREMVHQYAQNDRRVLPPSGLPLGNLQGGFGWMAAYGPELGATCYPADGSKTTPPYALYDRWGDSFNTGAEFVIVNQARSLATLACLAATTPLARQPWKSTKAIILPPTQAAKVGTPVALTLRVSGLDLGAARVVWEAQGQEPHFGGSAYQFTPSQKGMNWVEAEVQWPDGRRAFATTSFPVTP